MAVLASVGCVEDGTTGANEALSATSGDVITRARLGNNTEDITFVDRGRLANHAIAVDGGEVLAINTLGRPAAARRLFNTHGLGLVAPPRGVAFLSRDNHLVFNDAFQRDRLFVTDLDGNPVAQIAIQYDGFVPDHVEGLAVVPNSAADHAGTLAMVGWRFGAQLEVRVLYIDRDSGVVADDVVVDPSVAANGITAIAHLGDRLLVSPVNREIQTLALDGSVTGAPVELSELESIEGIAAVRGGLVVAGYGAGRLVGLDRSLARRARFDRDYLVGLGHSRVHSVAWDDDAGALLAAAQVAGPGEIAAITPDLSSSSIVAVTPGGGLLNGVTAVAGTDEVIAGNAFAPNGLLVFDNGALSTVVDVGFAPPREVAYIPATGELAVAFFGEPPSLIHFFDRDGTPTRDIDFGASAGVPQIAGLDHDGATLVLADAAGVVYETDLDGALLDATDYSTNLGADFPYTSNLAVLRTGANVGALAFTCNDTNEVVIVTR